MVFNLFNLRIQGDYKGGSQEETLRTQLYGFSRKFRGKFGAKSRKENAAQPAENYQSAATCERGQEIGEHLSSYKNYHANGATKSGALFSHLIRGLGALNLRKDQLSKRRAQGHELTLLLRREQYLPKL